MAWTKLLPAVLLASGFVAVFSMTSVAAALGSTEGVRGCDASRFRFVQLRPGHAPRRGASGPGGHSESRGPLGGRHWSVHGYRFLFVAVARVVRAHFGDLAAVGSSQPDDRRRVRLRRG